MNEWPIVREGWKKNQREKASTTGTDQLPIISAGLPDREGSRSKSCRGCKCRSKLKIVRCILAYRIHMYIGRSEMRKRHRFCVFTWISVKKIHIFLLIFQCKWHKIAWFIFFFHSTNLGTRIAPPWGFAIVPPWGFAMPYTRFYFLSLTLRNL